jgi:hypothetical protein
MALHRGEIVTLDKLHDWSTRRTCQAIAAFLHFDNRALPKNRTN